MGIACFPCPQQSRARSVLGTGVCFTVIILWITSGWSQENVQAGLWQNCMFQVMGTQPHNPLCCTSSKVSRPFKHTYKLQNISPYSTPCRIRQKGRVNRNYFEKIPNLPVSFTKSDATPLQWEGQETFLLHSKWHKPFITAVGWGLSCNKNETFEYLMENTFLHLMFSPVFLILCKGCSNVM